MSNDIRSVFDGSARRPVERRRGLDRRGKIGLALSIIGWTLWAAGMYMVSLAAPESMTFIDRIMHKIARISWYTGYLYVAVIFYATGALLCIFSLLQFRKRYRRRSDKKHTGILTALAVNLISLFGFGTFTIILDLL